MKKSATAGTHFNARVVECRLAAKVLLITQFCKSGKKAPFKPDTYYLFASRDNIRDFFLRKGEEERRSSTQGETLLAVSEKLV